MMPADRWQFEKVGLGYRCWSDEIQTEFRLSHIKRSHGDLTGELEIRANFKDVKTRDGVLHVARLNVLSTSARTSLARALEKRTPGLDMDWFDGLEWLCQCVILAEQQGNEVVDLSTLPARDAHAKYLVEPLMLKNMPSLLFGPGGVGKSLIALACGLSVAAGREIIPGIPPALKGNVLYLDWETDADEIVSRMEAIHAGHKFGKVPGFFYRQCQTPLADDVESLAALVAERDIIAIIIDSAAHAMGVSGEYGDANESTIRLHQALRLIGVGSLTIDHVNKTDSRSKTGGTATAYGSAYKMNATRNAWEVRLAKGSGVNLYHAKTNVSKLLDPMSVVIDWEPKRIAFRSSGPILEDVPDPDAAIDTSDLISDLLSDGEEMQIGAIASTLTSATRKDNTIRTTVYRMTERGLLTKTSVGGYKLTNPPIKFPTTKRWDS